MIVASLATPRAPSAGVTDKTVGAVVSAGASEASLVEPPVPPLLPPVPDVPAPASFSPPQMRAAVT